jgi:predicted DNA-binding transcriptional regulator AlpA
VKDDLRSVPTLDELARDPVLAGDLELETVKALLVKHAVAGQALLTALLAAKPAEDPDTTITANAAGEILGMSAKWIYDHADELPFVVRMGRSIRASRRAVMEYARSRLR